MAINVDIRYNNVETIDTRFSDLLELVLFKDATLIPNVTYTDKYELDNAGQIVVRRPNKIATKLGKATESGALDFDHTHTKDELINIILDQVFSASEKVYERIEQARVSLTGANKLALAIESVREDFELWGLGILTEEGTALPNTAELATYQELKEEFLEARKTLRKEGAKPNAFIVSVDKYNLLLEAAGKEYFPNSNEEVLRTGVFGKFYGVNVIESNNFDEADNGVEFVLYDYEAFSIVEQIETIRLIDAGHQFVGSLAQVQRLAGGKVTAPERVAVKKVA